MLFKTNDIAYFLQALGGNGQNGGSGGRIAGEVSLSQFEGQFQTQGGAAHGGEVGAAGTMLFTDFTEEHKLLRVYNRKGTGV